MAYTIKQANEYIAENKSSVDTTFRPRYHMTVPIGWMNDPNGLILYKGEYHLFYQYNPYDTLPGAMHWGHFVSSDLISYKNCEVALSPDAKDEMGCYSGGAIETGGVLNILYTRHFEIADIKKEQVCIVKSKSAQVFDKRALPVFDNDTLPQNVSREDFRDPYPVKVGDEYYVFVGGKDKFTDEGVIIVLRGNSLDKLDYGFSIGPYHELGDMAECPSFFHAGGKDIIVVSGTHVAEKNGCYKNTHSTVFMVGEVDFKGKTFNLDFIKEIDKGDAFYAPQLVSGETKPIIVGWLEMWNKPYPTRDLGHGWVGAFTIPRELEITDDDVLQRPVSALESYLSDHDDLSDLPRSAVIDATLNVGDDVRISGDDGTIVIGNDGGVYLDMTNANNQNGCIRRAPAAHQAQNVKIIIDVSTVEVFVDDGRCVISSQFYINGRLRLHNHEVKVKIHKIGEKS